MGGEIMSRKSRSNGHGGHLHSVVKKDEKRWKSAERAGAGGICRYGVWLGGRNGVLQIIGKQAV